MLELRTFPTRSVLTRRQPEVAACLVHGLTNKETAREFNVSPHPCTCAARLPTGRR
jgi:DNA-binding NarL/FixJ family response regulator